jgi:hypothetical protein
LKSSTDNSVVIAAIRQSWPDCYIFATQKVLASQKVAMQTLLNSNEVNMASPGITKALERLDRIQVRAKTERLVKSIKGDRLTSAGVTLVGAVLAGAADAKYKEADGTPKKVGPVPVVAGLAAVAAIVGLSDMVPGGSYIAMVGVGGLSYELGKMAHDHIANG